MRNTWAVCKREFASYFYTPVGYVVVGMVTLIAGIGFTASFLTYSDMSQAPHNYGYGSVPDFEETLLSPFLVFCGMLLMFVSPLITMRLLAEERNRGTIELLLTLPLRDREIIFGKFAAAVGMICLILLLLGVEMAIVAWFVDIEWIVLIFGLFTVLLMSMAFLSIGLFVSSITRNQITSGAITFGVCLLLYVAGRFAEDLPVENPAPENVPGFLATLIGGAYGVFRGFANELSLDRHAREMAQGFVAPADVLYYILVTAFFLFLTFRALESRHWRG